MLKKEYLLPVRIDTLEMPEDMREALPRAGLITVLPLSMSKAFQDTLKGASVYERPDGRADLVGFFRTGRSPVFLTGVHSKDGRRIDGYLDLKPHRLAKRKDGINFTVLYGSPGTINFDWERLYEMLESQFHLVYQNPHMRRSVISALESRLRPFHDVLEQLKISASAVTFTGVEQNRKILEAMGISNIPIITRICKRAIEFIWPDLGFEIQEQGQIRLRQDRDERIGSGTQMRIRSMSACMPI